MQTISIECADGQVLSGRYFPATTEHPREPVVMAPATGIRQSFYFSFCRWLAEQGHPSLTFDHRGVGESLSGPVKSSPARLQDWGQLDQPAALDRLRELTGAEQVVWMGHSAGGQMMGLFPNHASILRVLGVSSSTGHLKNMDLGFRLFAEIFMRGWFPLTARLTGAVRLKKVGWGEDLPAQVGLQWADWCRRGHYAGAAIGRTIHEHWHEAFRAPMVLLFPSDDTIAVRANVMELAELFPQAPVQCVEVVPKEHGLTAIGHMGWFRDRNRGLWPMMLRGLRGEPI